MYQKVKAYMKEHGMVVDGDVVLAGVSGGGDSMAMLEMLKRYQAEATFSLCAVHVHHGIRGEEADRDERVVRETCEKWTIPFLSYHYPVPELAKKWKMGLEETGRKVRQDAFSRAEADYFGKSETADLQGGGRVSAAREGKLRIRIALAHNENDVAETLLHNLCRGTGLKGLASILPVRDEIIRPILCLNKQEIVNYLIKEQIPYVTDSTNLTDDYTRNKIRHQILPILEEQVNASAVRHMAETASLVSQAEEYLSRQGERLVKKYGENRERGIFLSEAFWRDEPAIASYGVLQVFEELAGKRKDFTAAHVKSVESLLKLQVGRRINLPYDLAALRTYGGILLGERQLLGMSDRNLSPKEYDPVKSEKNQERNALQKSVQLSKKELETACEQVLFTDNVFYLKIFSNEGQKIEEKTKIPMSTASLGLVGSYQDFDIKRLHLVTPYIKEMNDAIIREYEKLGLTAAGVTGLGITENTEIGSVTKEQLETLCCSTGAGHGEGIAVVCTNLAAAWRADLIEKRSGAVVFDSVTAAVREALKLCGLEKLSFQGWGKLLDV